DRVRGGRGDGGACRVGGADPAAAGQRGPGGPRGPLGRDPDGVRGEHAGRRPGADRRDGAAGGGSGAGGRPGRGPRPRRARGRAGWGLVSVYSSTTGVVVAAFLPLGPGLAARLPGCDTILLASAVVVGGNISDSSPLSTIGALCLAAAPAEDRKALFARLLGWG